MSIFSKIAGAAKGLLGGGGPLAKITGLQVGDEVQDKEAERRNAMARLILFSCIGVALIILAVRC